MMKPLYHKRYIVVSASATPSMAPLSRKAPWLRN